MQNLKIIIKHINTNNLALNKTNFFTIIYKHFKAHAEEAVLFPFYYKRKIIFVIQLSFKSF